MQERSLWFCWTPQVDWLIFPASPLHSRIAFSRALLIPASPRSLRCAKPGVARVETASPNASAAAPYLVAPYLVLRIIIDLLQCAPRAEATHPGGNRWLQRRCRAASLPAAARRNVYKTVMSRAPCVECGLGRLKRTRVEAAIVGRPVGAANSLRSPPPCGEGLGVGVVV